MVNFSDEYIRAEDLEQEVSEELQAKASSRLCLVEPSEGEAWDLQGEDVTLGKRSDNDIHLPVDGVSRYHARLRREAHGWVVEDNRSRNGVFVRGERIRLHALQDGDEFLVGTALLRYERIKPQLLDVAREWLEADRRRPLGVGVGLAVLMLMMVVFSSGGGSLSLRQGTQAPAEFLSANDLLCDGNYDGAIRAFQRLLVHAPVGTTDRLRSLKKVAETFDRSDFGAPTYAWDDAEKYLKRAAKLKDLPPRTREWLKAQAAWVEAGREGAKPILRAEDAASRGQEFLGAGEVVSGVASLEAAVVAFDGIEEASPFSELATKRAAQLRGQAMGLLLDMARQEVEVERPRYDLGLELAERAAQHATTKEDKATAQRLISEMKMNQEDEDRLAKAVRILSSRQLDRYPRAVELLEAIDRRSLVYEEGRSWIAWTQADGHTRRAQQLFDQGDVRDALKLLDKAANAHLGEVALQNLRERRERWSLVRDASERGQRLSRAGQVDRARQEFEAVLAMEPNPANRFHRLATDQLRYLHETTRGDQQRIMRRGLQALSKGDYPAAHRAFEEVRRDRRRRHVDGARIARAVRKVNDERNLLEQATRTILEDDTDRFTEVHDTLEMLWRWLHPRDPQRLQVRKQLQAVAKRLRSLAVAAKSTK